MSTIDFSHFRLLAIFTVVVDSGSFAGAARKLKSSRSRISEQVSQLENDLGIRLLQRTTRQLKMTSEGQRVYQKASQLPAILESIEAISRPETPSGRVAITMNHDIAHKFVLPVLSDLRSRYPKLQLELILDDARLDLIDEQIDIAIRIGIPKDESLIARVMHEERFALYASPDLLSNRGVPKTLKQLESYPWIILSQTSESEVQHLRHRDKTISIRPNQYYRCNSPLMVQQLVCKGHGIGALLPSTVKHEIEEGELLPIMPSISSEMMVFSLVYPSRRQVPLRTRTVIDFLLKANMFG